MKKYETELDSFQKFIISHKIFNIIPNFPTHGYQKNFQMKFNDFKKLYLIN